METMKVKYHEKAVETVETIVGKPGTCESAVLGVPNVERLWRGCGGAVKTRKSKAYGKTFSKKKTIQGARHTEGYRIFSRLQKCFHMLMSSVNPLSELPPKPTAFLASSLIPNA